MENSMAISQKAGMESPYDPVIALLGIYPRELNSECKAIQANQCL